MKVSVTVVRGPEKGRRREFAQPGRYVFGCDAACHFPLSREDPFLSGRHFLIEVDSQRCFLQHLGGPNAPQVNGRPAMRTELQDGDEVQAGTTRLRFSIVPATLCHWCKDAEAPIFVPHTEAVKDPEAADREIYAHEGCVPKDRHHGRMIGEYLCCSRLGGGGFGDVFLVHQPSSSRVYAIKTATQSTDETSIRRFRREARLLQMLRHTNIVHCVGSGVEPDGTTYLVSEYVSGGDLDHLIKVRGALPLAEAIPIMTALLDALVYLQSPPRPTEHRDLKPANVLLAACDGGAAEIIPRLTDFGVSKAFGVIATPLTLPGNIIGTLQYIAPEIVQFGITPDEGFHAEPDVYSLGATFYFMLTRHQPFEFPASLRTPEILLHILRSQPVPIAERLPSLPEGVAAVIDRACAKDPKKRFSNAAEFRKAFLTSALQTRA